MEQPDHHKEERRDEDGKRLPYVWKTPCRGCRMRDQNGVTSGKKPSTDWKTSMIMERKRGNIW